MENQKKPLFIWGIIDITGKVSIEVFDTGDDSTRFTIVSDPAGSARQLILDEASVRCIQRHLKAALDYMDAI